MPACLRQLLKGFIKQLSSMLFWFGPFSDFYLFPWLLVSRSHSVTAACARRQQPAPPREPDAWKSQQRAGPEASQVVSKERPPLTADGKAHADGRVLVAKFLEHASCVLPAEARHMTVTSEECHPSRGCSGPGVKRSPV